MSVRPSNILSILQSSSISQTRPHASDTTNKTTISAGTAFPILPLPVIVPLESSGGGDVASYITALNQDSTWKKETYTWTTSQVSVLDSLEPELSTPQSQV